MIKINNCSLEDYKLDEKNSIPEEKPSRLDPGHASEIALEIKSIMIEEKTALIKTLKEGLTVSFDIDQEIDHEYYDRRKKDYIDVKLSVKGEGQGEVKELKYFDDSMEDDEYQEVEVVLTNGYGDRL